MASEEQSQLSADLEHEHGFRLQYRARTSTWLLWVTQATDINSVYATEGHQIWPLVSAWDWTSPWPQLAAQASQIRLILTTIMTPVPLLFIAHKPLCFSSLSSIHNIPAHHTSAVVVFHSLPHCMIVELPYQKITLSLLTSYHRNTGIQMHTSQQAFDGYLEGWNKVILQFQRQALLLRGFTTVLISSILVRSYVLIRGFSLQGKLS